MPLRPNRRQILVAGSLGAATLATGVLAQSRTGGTINQMHAGQALMGYDAVAYFSGKAAKGDAAHSTEWGGGAWHFATAANLAAFTRDPARYAPQYGGFCAWGVANRKLFAIDPVAGWAVEGGKLFVFFNADVKGLWQADRAALLAAAEANWPALNA